MKEQIRGCGLIALSLVLAGCSGTLVTTPPSVNAKSACETRPACETKPACEIQSRSFLEYLGDIFLRGYKSEKKGCLGVPFRVSEPGVEYYAFTTLVTKKKKGVYTGNQCSPDFLPRPVSVASQGLYYIYNNDSSWYESHNLAVALNGDGTLSSVNTESSPDVAKEFAKTLAKGGLRSLGVTVGSVSDKAKESSSFFVQSVGSVNHHQPPPPPCNAGPVAVFGQCSQDAEKNCEERAKERWNMWKETNDRK